MINEAVATRARGRAADAIDAYHGYRQRGVAPGRHVGLPSPSMTLIFTIDEPLHIAQQVDPRRASASYDSIVGGLHDAPAVITHDGAQSGIQLSVDPLASRAVFGMPARELVGHDGDTEAVFGRLALELPERLRLATGWAERFAAVNAAMGMAVARRDRVPNVNPAVAQAWRLLNDSAGTVAMRTVARAVGYSERQLAKRFRAELGMTPKVAARIVRFDHARREIQRAAARRELNIGQIAACRGYFDQSHLVRDFTQFAGCSPTQWLDEDVANLQADEDRSDAE